MRNIYAMVYAMLHYLDHVEIDILPLHVSHGQHCVHTDLSTNAYSTTAIEHHHNIGKQQYHNISGVNTARHSNATALGKSKGILTHRSRRDQSRYCQGGLIDVNHRQLPRY